MSNARIVSAGVVAGVILVAALRVGAQNKPGADQGEQERKVTEKDVPAAAMVTLKKMANGAKFTEFSEEIEHGNKFYEGSWDGPDGKIDCLVTEAGDLVELEEKIPADKAPAGVRSEAQKQAGAGGKIHFEKKTMVLYEIHFKKDNKHREMVYTPDARRYYEHGPVVAGEKDEDGDDDKDE